MKADHPTQDIRKMIENFRIPSTDALAECWLSIPNDQQRIIDAGIFISTKQSEGFYSDIFHFWVRAFFFFVEDMNLGIFFQDAIPLIECKEISTSEFRNNYFALFEKRKPGFFFIENQQNPQTYIEINNRTFSKAYIVLDRPNIKSAVASSDGEYVAYFQTMPKGNN